MKRRTSHEAVGIWSAFARAPADGGDVVRRELRQAHDYYNKLVRLELDRRAMYRAARGAIGETLPALDQALANVTAQIKAEAEALNAKRGKARKRVEDPAASARIAELKKQREGIRVQIKLARTEVEVTYGPGDAEFTRRTAEKANGNTAPRVRERTNKETLAEMMTEPQWSADWKLKARIDFEANQAKKLLLAECGLTPGTYLLTQKAVEAAFAPAPKGKPPKADPTEKDGFYGEGRLGVQLHRLSVAELLSGSNARIALRMSDRLPKGAKAQQRYGTLRMEVGRGGHCVEFPVKLYRPLPPDGIITQAWIRAARLGPRTEYTFQCVIETAAWIKEGPIKGSGTVAVDTGWRVMDDNGLRVAYWVDDHGRHGDIRVPQRVRSAVDYADSLRGIADTHFNAACKEVRAWMAMHPQHVPVWLRNATTTIAHWRSHGDLIRVARRLASDHGLWREWRVDRKAAGLDLFASYAETGEWLGRKFGAVHPVVQLGVYLETWRRKDRHLYDWETRERTYAQNARRDLFRKVAQVARQYEHVLVEEIDLPKFSRNASPEEKAAQDWLHRTLRIAAPGDLAARIMEACKGRAEKVAAVNNTRKCHKCGHVNAAWEHQEERVQTCAGCGAVWDQDENACRVMLSRWHAPPREQSGDVQPPVPARGAEDMPEDGQESREDESHDYVQKPRGRNRSQRGPQDRERTVGPA